MKVIQQNCDVHATPEEAQDALFGLSHLPGFVMGYIDEKENRPVVFFLDVPPASTAQRGQRRRELVFPAKSAAKQDTNAAMTAIWDAINNGVDMTKR